MKTAEEKEKEELFNKISDANLDLNEFSSVAIDVNDKVATSFRLYYSFSRAASSMNESMAENAEHSGSEEIVSEM